MWRTFVVPVLHKQVGLLRNSKGCCKSRLFSVHLSENECSQESKCTRSSIADQQDDCINQNIVKAHSTIVGILLKLPDSYNGKVLETKVETHFPLVQSLLDHINQHSTIGKESQNSELTVCTPKTRGNEKESGFGFKNVYFGFEKWCFGVVVVSGLISWHRMLFKDERHKLKKDLSIWKSFDVNVPLRVLPVNSPAKPIDPLDEALSFFESAMTECTAVTENALAIRFSELNLHAKALRFFQSASSKGNVAAHFNVGLCYEKGLGTMQDISKAVNFYTAAASQGHGEAAFNLGIIFLQEEHFNTNKKTDGLEMVEKAARKGLTKAQSFLGLYYADESNEHYDMRKSVQWLKKAAEQNDSKAQYHLGICYERGFGVARNMKKAREMYGCAAENGHTEAQFNFGVFHEHGLGGLSIDKYEALRWYKISAEKGNKNAKDNLEYLQRDIGAWKATPNLLETLFSDIRISKKQTASDGAIMSRCSSSPGRLFSMQTDSDSDKTVEQSPQPSSIAYEDNKRIWVI